MISYLRGRLLDWTEDGTVTVDVNGVGFEVGVPTRTLGAICNSPEVELYTYLSVKEDGMSLFGFSTKEEMQLFKKIIGVSGVGPKGGLSILSSMNKEQFITAVLSDDDKSISKANGIGKKTAQKIVLELKDKFSMADAFNSHNDNSAVLAAVSGASSSELEAVKQDAVLALVSLGYTNSEAMKAVRSLQLEEGMTVDKVLRLALKNI